MERIELNKTNPTIDLGKLQLELFRVVGCTSDKVLIDVNDNLNLTEDQISVLQNVVDNLNSTSKQFVNLEIAEIYDVLSSDDLSLLINDNLFKSLINSRDYITFKTNFANTFLTYIGNILSEQGVTDIRNLIISKNLPLGE